MKLLNRTTSTVTEDTFEIERESPSYPHNKEKIIYKEFLNEKGRVIDFELRNENGESIAETDTGATLIEEIQEFVDKL